MEAGDEGLWRCRQVHEEVWKSTWQRDNELSRKEGPVELLGSKLFTSWMAWIYKTSMVFDSIEGSPIGHESIYRSLLSANFPHANERYMTWAGERHWRCALQTGRSL